LSENGSPELRFRDLRTFLSSTLVVKGIPR
jgi:hypothetical protein